MLLFVGRPKYRRRSIQLYLSRFTKGSNFCDFQFSLVSYKTSRNGAHLYRKNLFQGSNFYFLRIDNNKNDNTNNNNNNNSYDNNNNNKNSKSEKN